MTRAPWFLSGPALLTALLVNLPLAYLLIRVYGEGLEELIRVTLSSATGLLLAETLLLVAGVLSLAVAIALPAAWLVTRTDLPGRRLFALVHALPLVFPSYVAAFSLVAVAGPRGFVQGWLEALGIQRLPDLAYGYSGALISLGLYTYPYIFLPVVAALRGIDPALEQSSRSLGAGRWQTFRWIVLPQLRGALLAGGLLVVLYTLSDFGAVSIVRYNTLTLGIYNAYETLFRPSTAAVQAAILVFLTFGFLALQTWLRRGARPLLHRAARPADPAPLGRWKWFWVAAQSALGLLILGPPTGVALFWGLRAWIVGNPWGEVGNAVLHSVGVSATAAAAATLLAVPIAAWSVRYPGTLSHATERMSYSGNALPGLVIALAMVFLANRFLPAIYQTLTLLVLAYVVRFIPEATAAVHSALSTIARGFEEAARSLGRGPFETLRTISLPMIRPGLLAGAGLVFLTAMKELPATLVLRPTGFETLATRIWSAASEGFYSEAAAPTLLLLLASGVPAYLLTIRPLLVDRS